MTETLTVRTGIDVDQLLATIDAIKDDPNAATFTFRTSGRWQEGTHNVGEIGRFVHAGQEDQTPRRAVPAQRRRATSAAREQQGAERSRAAAAGARVLLRRRVRR